MTDSTLAAPGSSHVADGSADVANGNTNVANGTTDVADGYNHIEGVMSIRSFFSDKRDGIHYLSVRGALSHLIGLSPNSGDEQWETEAQCESEIEARNDNNDYVYGKCEACTDTTKFTANMVYSPCNH